MNLRLQPLFFIVTAFLTAIAIFVLNDVGSNSPISDGGSHFVTGLLAFDWLHARPMGNPIAFGTEYFKHLPYIGILLWPPLFYGMEMVVFSIFGATTKVALMLGSAIFAAGAALLGYSAWKSGKSPLLAHCIGAAVLASALVQEVQRNLLVDGLVSVLSLAAMFQFTKYVVNPSWRGAFVTGLLAVLAFYAKGNALQLGIAFPVAALMLGRPGMLIDRRTLAMAAGCLVLTAPWLYITAGLSAQGFLYSASLASSLHLVIAHLNSIFHAMPILAPFLVLGAVRVAFQSVRSSRPSDPAFVFDAACLSIILACIAFHTLIPAGADPRYMLTAVWAGFGLAISGLETAIRWVAGRSGRTPKNPTVALLCVLVLSIQAFAGFLTPLPVIPAGAATVAAEVMKSLPESNRSILISGDHLVETALGPALAQLDGNRRASKDGIVVLRGSRAFAGGNYRNSDYIETFTDDAQYRQELQRLAVPVVVTANAKPGERWGHISAIQRVMEAADSDYVKVSVLPFFKSQQMTIWRRKEALVKPIEFELVTKSNTLRERASQVIR